MKTRHFLTLMDLSAKELKHLLARAIKLKAMQQRGKKHMPLTGKTMAMIFEKSSTRTRVSFQVGMAQLGGTSLFLSPRDWLISPFRVRQSRRVPRGRPADCR